MKRLYAFPPLLGLLLTLGACDEVVKARILLSYAGTQIPAANMTVELCWDAPVTRTNPFGEQHPTKRVCKSYMTNHQGILEVSFDEDPMILDLSMKLENDHFLFMQSAESDPLGEGQLSTYTFTSRFNASDFMVEKKGLIDLDLGGGEVALAWAALNNAYAMLDGYAMPKINVFLGRTGKTAGTWRLGKNRLDVNLSSTALKEWREQTIWHEYGHAVMSKLTHDPNVPLKCLYHAIGTPTNTNCAWVEGWANFFALTVARVFQKQVEPTFKGRDMEHYVADYDPKAIRSSVDGYEAATETEGYYTTDLLEGDPDRLRKLAPKDEGRVAAALWDLYDSKDDCSEEHGDLSGGSLDSDICDYNSGHAVSLRQMLMALDGWLVGTPPSITQFYDRLSPKLSAPAQEAAAVILEFNLVRRASKAKRSAASVLAESSDATVQSGASPVYPRAQSFAHPGGTITGVELNFVSDPPREWSFRILSALPPQIGQAGAVATASIEGVTQAQGAGLPTGAGWTTGLLDSPTELPAGTYFLFIDSVENGGADAMWAQSQAGLQPGPYPDGTGWVFVYSVAAWSDNSNYRSQFERHFDYAFRVFR